MLGLRRGNAYRNIAPHHSPSQMNDRSGFEPDDAEWEPHTLTTVATRGEGVDALIEVLDAHRLHIRETGELEVRRRKRLERHTREVVGRMLDDLVWRRYAGERVLSEGMDEILDGTKSPYGLAHEIVNCLQQGETTNE